jgi:integrase
MVFMSRKEVSFMINYTFTSVFMPFFKDFLHIKETMGFNTAKIEYIFKEFDLFFSKKGVGSSTITRELIAQWRESRINDSERTLYDKWSILSQFTRYMCQIGYPCYVPRMPRKKDWNYVPYIFTHTQMLDIFNAADSLRMPCLLACSKLFSIPALLRTLYATGMRVGEAISLKNEDIDLEKNLILIRKTKNQRQRIVPITVSLGKVLTQYISYRNKMPLVNMEDRDSTFFIAPDGSALSNSAIGTWFRKILKQCGIPYIGGNHGPRIHDIRHTCAVHSLMAQVRSGADIYCVLPILSTFLGHKTLAGTERYVRLTQEMYPDIVQMEESISSYVFPSLSLIMRADENK